MQLLRFLALTLSPAFTAAARPGLTVAAVQLLVALAVHGGLASLSPGLSWLIAPPTLVVGLIFAILETLARHDRDLASILRQLHLDRAISALGAFSATLLFAALGLPEGEARALAESAPAHDTAAIQLLAQSSGPAQLAAGVAGVGINLTLTHLRAELLDFLEDLHLDRIWNRLETGGVVVALLLLPLLPVLLLVGLVAFALIFGAAAVLVTTWRRRRDRARRRPCAACSYALRVEASRCPQCQAQRTPEALQSPTFGERIQALRG